MVGPGWNSYTLWRGSPITTSYVHRSTVGTLVVDFVESVLARSAAGTVRGASSNQKNIVDAVRRMLENFPP